MCFFLFFVNYENLFKKVYKKEYLALKLDQLYTSATWFVIKSCILSATETQNERVLKCEADEKGLHCEGFLTRSSEAAAGTSGGCFPALNNQKDKECTEKTIMWNNLHFLLVTWIY